MKILHVSDNHGVFPELQDRDSVDVIVHSGDLMPNRTFGVRPVEETFQAFWLEDNATRLARWIGDKPFVYCPGNHDYVCPVPALRAAGVDAHSICDRFLELDGVGFYGFPWVPVFYDWNYMANPTELEARLEPAVELLDQGAINVFVAHGPMHGVLDRTRDGTRAGSRVLRETMQNAKHPPKLLLCGHIHEAAGLLGWSRGMVVSNAAMTQRILSVWSS